MTLFPLKPAAGYRLLHTADWHLGKLLNEQSRDEEHARFLKWLLEVVARHEVDAIIVAGDIFDAANPPQSALARYYDFVSALFKQGGCELAAIGGNHDSAAVLEAPKRALRTLRAHVAGHLADEPSDRILCLPDRNSPKVAIALVPFLRDRDIRVGRAGETPDDIREQLVAGIRKQYEETAAATDGLECPIIATGHLTVLGASSSDSERDIHIGGLGAITNESFSDRFSYVALGHLHRPQSTDANDRVRYSGSPIALSFSEASDIKEVRILDVNDGSIVQNSLHVPVFRQLAQVRTKSADLAKDLTEFQSGNSELTPWLEVVVEDASLETDLIELVRQLVQSRDFEVLKVLRGRSGPVGLEEVGDATDDEAIESLLERPARVFEHLLEQSTELAEDEIAELNTAFSLLVELDAQNLRGETK